MPRDCGMVEVTDRVAAFLRDRGRDEARNETDDGSLSDVGEVALGALANAVMIADG